MKRFIAILLVFSIIISLTGCHVNTDAIAEYIFEQISNEIEEEKAKIRDQIQVEIDKVTASINHTKENLGNWFSGLGKGKDDVSLPTQESEHDNLPDQITESPTQGQEYENMPDQPADIDEAFLSYDTYGVTGLFDDYDWDYMTRDQNWFINATGYVSHWLANAKGKYKEAYRAYIKEFVVNNEYRNSTEDITFEEEKEQVLMFLENVKKAITESLDFVSTEATVAELLLNEYDGITAMLKEAIEFTEDFENNFGDLMARTVLFVDDNKLKLSVEITPAKQFVGTFNKVAKVADVVTLAIDVVDCIKTRSDILAIQKRASEFFELTNIFNTIIEKTTNKYMRDAAKEVLEELRENGYITDLDDLIERTAVHAVIDINPIVSVTGGLIDVALTEFTPLKDLDSAYAADAVRHIKMACCELLRESVDYFQGKQFYFAEENTEKVNVYVMHCLQSQLVYTYTVSDGKNDDATVLAYVAYSGVSLPQVAHKYILSSFHFSEDGSVHGGAGKEFPSSEDDRAHGGGGKKFP